VQRCGVGDQNLPLDARRALFTTDLCATAKSGASLVSERNQKPSETIRSELMRTNLALTPTPTLTLNPKPYTLYPIPFTLTPAPVPGATCRRAAGGPPPASWA